ncbi:hypothetical protein J1605_001369 [Eschrichtius robustus]|uniref:Transient receptor ion channel domain-containing protein n=1 Tax=Eschrichtius robustus TaxID=9764 RepID=A0AB34I6R6_ESCRO|nr:hypothetical protein J1605_001369 [Eschrichtius robustus]
MAPYPPKDSSVFLFFGTSGVELVISRGLWDTVQNVFPSVSDFIVWHLTPVPLVSRPQPKWTKIVNRKLKFPPPLLGAIGPGNVEEAEDRSWRGALNLAIRLGHEAITDVLLASVKFDFRQIHEALLVAVDKNQLAVVRRLLAWLEREKGRKKDLYEITQLLMDQGHTIARPHPISCACLECSNTCCYDLLQFSLSRINTCRGIASCAHLSLASEDAMLAAFQLSCKLRRLAHKEPEFKPEYIALESLSQDYSFELLGMCRHQSEVTAVLNDLGKDSKTEPEAEGLGQAFEEGIPNLARLRLAITYNQKRHPPSASRSCPPSGVGTWLAGVEAPLPGSSLVAFLIFLTMLFLCLGHWLAPKSRLGHLMKIPVLKFLLHSASYLWFRIFLLGESLVMETQPECLGGFTTHGLGCRLPVAAFALLAGLAHRHCRDAPDGAACRYFTSAERSEWRTQDHQFLAEISIGRMIDDMIRFMFILTIILTAFLCGLNNVYVPYQETERLGNFNETFQFLFWTMFGMEEHSVVDMPQFLALEFVGQALYGIFTIVTVILLLNMLIAMIANSFQKIDTADMEWKFACSKLYLSYFREGLMLPVPFNILPSPKATFYLLREVPAWEVGVITISTLNLETFSLKKLSSLLEAHSGEANPGAGAGPGEEERGSYWLHVIKALVQRYIETARREFEETRQKDLGNRLTELTKTVSQLQSEVAGVQRTLVKGRLRRPPDGASILRRSITRVCNSFQNLGPPIPETPELTVPGIVGTQLTC